MCQNISPLQPVFTQVRLLHDDINCERDAKSKILIQLIFKELDNSKNRLKIKINLNRYLSIILVIISLYALFHDCSNRLTVATKANTRVETLIVATIYLQLIQNRYMFRSFTVLQCSHQHCVQPFASDVEVVGYL